MVNIGTFGPFPEIYFALVSGVGLFEGEPVPLEGEAFLVEVAAAEAGDIDTEVAKTIPFDERVVFSGDDGVSDGGEMEGSPQ